MPSIAEVMTRDVLVVEGDIQLKDAAARMVARGVGAVIVLEGERLLGILTERDVLRAVASGRDGKSAVDEWMTRDPEVVDMADTTDYAAALMIHGGFRHLPVVEEDKVVGIVSIRDLMRVALADSSPRGA